MQQPPRSHNSSSSSLVIRNSSKHTHMHPPATGRNLCSMWFLNSSEDSYQLAASPSYCQLATVPPK
jgi:hypothetical protein